MVGVECHCIVQIRSYPRHRVWPFSLGILKDPNRHLAPEVRHDTQTVPDVFAYILAVRRSWRSFWMLQGHPNSVSPIDKQAGLNTPFKPSLSIHINQEAKSVSYKALKDSVPPVVRISVLPIRHSRSYITLGYQDSLPYPKYTKRWNKRFQYPYKPSLSTSINLADLNTPIRTQQVTAIDKAVIPI